jgi:hypothetical protein
LPAVNRSIVPAGTNVYPASFNTAMCRNVSRRARDLHEAELLFDVEHAYGPACYQPGRCADLVRRLAQEIDASAIDPSLPTVFPRLVQHALWRFCAHGIDDNKFAAGPGLQLHPRPQAAFSVQRPRGSVQRAFDEAYGP